MIPTVEPQIDPQSPPNAVMIAAARDLLDALKAIVGPDLTYLDGCVMSGCISREKIIAGREAVAKATTVFPF